MVTLHENIINLWHYLADFFSEWEMFQIKVVEKIKKHALCTIFFFSENHVYNAEKYDTARHSTNANTILSRKDAICMPDN
jgi:hypothetical protein